MIRPATSGSSLTTSPTELARPRLAADLTARQAVLIGLGERYEAERNVGVVKRVWRWAWATLGLGGLIAVCLLCPAVIPIMGQLLGWLVARIPSLAGALGVVSKRAFDSVLTGVGKLRAELKRVPNEGGAVLGALDAHLDAATGADGSAEKRLIEARRAVLKV